MEQVTIDTLAKSAEGVAMSIDTLWVLIAAALVFFMQAGFALVEAGFTRSKNTVNILTKNLIDFAVGSLLFWVIGFSFMFGSDIAGFIGAPTYFSFMGGKVQFRQKHSCSFKPFLLQQLQQSFQVRWPKEQNLNLIFSIL